MSRVEGAAALPLHRSGSNFSIDLPEAAVAIQVSGTFGSRQEETTFGHPGAGAAPPEAH